MRTFLLGSVRSIKAPLAGGYATPMSSLSGHAITDCGLIGAGISAVLTLLSGIAWLASKSRYNRSSTGGDKSKPPRFLVVSGAFCLVCLSIALISNWATREPEHQPPLLSRAGIRRTFSPILELRERARERAQLRDLASLEPIDAHTHISQAGPVFVGMLERLHMHVLDILYVDDTTNYRASLEQQKRDALNFIALSKGRATLCTTFDPFRLGEGDFSQKAIDALNRDFAQGAVAAKVWKNIGMEIKKGSGQYLMPDDSAFEPIYKDIAAHHKTLIIHAADPDGAWNPKLLMAAGIKYYAANPEWDMSKKPEAPRKETILQARDHLLAMNRDLRVVGAHLGSMEDHLDDLAARFELYPNFAVDIAARVPRLILQPRDRVRIFFLKYQDRILYGTDLAVDAGESDQVASQAWQSQYLLDWRYLATDDTFEYRARQVQGLNLPRSVLQNIYHDNAVRWIPGVVANQQ